MYRKSPYFYMLIFSEHLHVRQVHIHSDPWGGSQTEITTAEHLHAQTASGSVADLQEHSETRRKVPAVCVMCLTQSTVYSWRSGFRGCRLAGGTTARAELWLSDIGQCALDLLQQQISSVHHLLQPSCRFMVLVLQLPQTCRLLKAASRKSQAGVQQW